MMRLIGVNRIWRLWMGHMESHLTVVEATGHLWAVHGMISRQAHDGDSQVAVRTKIKISRQAHDEDSQAVVRMKISRQVHDEDSQVVARMMISHQDLVVDSLLMDEAARNPAAKCQETPLNHHGDAEEVEKVVEVPDGEHQVRIGHQWLAVAERKARHPTASGASNPTSLREAREANGGLRVEDARVTTNGTEQRRRRERQETTRRQERARREETATGRVQDFMWIHGRKQVQKRTTMAGEQHRSRPVAHSQSRPSQEGLRSH